MRPTGILWSGLVNKVPWCMTRLAKFRQRKRLQHVDKILALMNEVAKEKGLKIKAIDKLNKLVIPESQMEPRDKYFVFSKKSKGYRKGAHKVPKWTRTDLRPVPPRGF